MLPGDSVGVGSEWTDEWGVQQVAGAENMSGVGIWWRLKCSFLHSFSLLSNSPSKAPRTKEISEDWRAAPSSVCFNWGEEFVQNKIAHLLETEKRGTHSPMTANAEWETLAAFHPTHQHNAPIPPGMLQGSYRQRGLSNPAFPPGLLSLTEREGLMIPWPFVGFLGGSINLDGCTNIYVPHSSLNGGQK